MDETTAPVLDPGRGTDKDRISLGLGPRRLPLGRRRPARRGLLSAPGRAGENAETFLTGCDGILQLDGYTGYNRLTRPSRTGGTPITVAHCWA